MKSEWKKVSLDDIAEIRTGKLDSNAATNNGQYPFFTCSPITLKIDDYAFEEEAVLLAGNNAAGIFPIKYYFGRFNAYQRTYVITARKNEQLEIRFLYYQLMFITAFIRELAVGSATQFLTHKILKPLLITLPPLSEQRRIAAVLGALDDKIELNREMNRTLEGMAQALFKSWFVDFDGCEDLVESEIGLVPRGWEVKPIGDVMELAYGKSLSKSKRFPGNIPVYGSGGVTGTHSESLVDGPGVIVGRKGSVGTLYWEDGSFFPIDTVFYVKTSSLSWLAWSFYILGTIDILQLGSDSAVPGVNRHALLSQRRAIPLESMVNQFWSVIAPLRERRSLCDLESRTLGELRNVLLPKLISGELRVEEAEALVGELV